MNPLLFEVVIFRCILSRLKYSFLQSKISSITTKHQYSENDKSKR